MVQPTPKGWYKGGVKAPPLLFGGTMKRTRMSAKAHGKKFSKARNKTRAINSPGVVMRGGIRL